MAISVKVMHRPPPETTSYLRAALSGMALTLKHMVNPNKIGDRTSQRLAREIARSIENELTYPGEVKVTLLRETRVTDYAR